MLEVQLIDTARQLYEYAERARLLIQERDGLLKVNERQAAEIARLRNALEAERLAISGCEGVV